MGNLLDADSEFRDLDTGYLRALVSRNDESVLRRGRAMMELGRRASADVNLLQEVAGMIRAPEYRQLRTVGTTSVAQLGTAGLVAGGGERALALARTLASEWDAGEQSDFAWLMRSSGVAWS
jgi:hypothetical protein